MRRVQRVPKQHDIFVIPALVLHHREAAPKRAVRDQPVPAQEMRPHFSKVGNRLRLAEPLQERLRLLPRRLGRLDDPGAHARLVLISAEIPNAVLVGREVERECLRGSGGPKPDEMVAAVFDLRLEMLLVFLTNEAVDAVRCNDQVGTVKTVEVLYFGLKAQLDAKLAAAPMQHVEQGAPLGSAESMSARPHHLTMEEEIDLVPVRELRRNAFVGLAVITHQIVERLVGEHDAEAERIVGLVSLVNRDVMRRIALLHQKREIKPSRPAADHGYLQAACSIRSW